MTTYEEVGEYISRWTKTINDRLPTGLAPTEGNLESALHYALSVKGKRLRPLLFLSFLDAYGIDPGGYIDIACAIECIHTYSLIHDDLPCMDDDDYRRGMPTVHKKFSEALALLTGDTMLTYAFEKIARAKAEPLQIVNIIRILTTGIGKDGMAGGQVLDLEFNGDKNVIFEIHRKKTAELITATIMSAAEITPLAEDEKRKLGEAALSIGIGFQMADDLLDIIGDEEEVGKRLNKDQGNQSPNCVLFYGEEYVRKEIDAAYQKTMTLLNQLNITFPPFLYLMEKMVYRSK